MAGAPHDGRSRARLTDAVVRKLAAPEKGNKIRYCGETPGFGCRVTAAGAKALILNYRIKGRERRFTIGAWPDWTVGTAREEAKRLKRDVDLGHDPLEERATDRTAPTIAELARRYREDHLPKKRSRRDDESMLDRDVLPVLARLKVADVRHADVERLHREISKRAPIRANRVVALLSRMFNLAIRWGWRADNPARGIERNHEDRRQRFLSPAEIARLAQVLDRHPERTSASLVKLLLLTGARFGETASATWDQFDLTAGVWTKPSAHTKQRKEHRVPLSAPARQLLAELKAANGSSAFVFPSSRGRPVTTIKKFWGTVCREAEIEGCRIHDLRHSHASILASAGLSLPVIGALLGHTQPGTTARYAHLLDDPLREAVERVGAMVDGKPSAQVVPLKRGS